MPETQAPTAATRRRAGQGVPALRRVVIEQVQPEIDDGRFPIKGNLGDAVTVQAAIHADGHDLLQAALRYRPHSAAHWQETRMTETSNDSWTGQFSIERQESYEYTLQAWVDAYETWRRDVLKKWEAGQPVASEMLEGARIVQDAGARATGPDAEALSRLSDALKSDRDDAARMRMVKAEALGELMARYPDRAGQTIYERILQVTVERERARFGAWYELFPRSAGPDPHRSATFREAESVLPDIAGMGFDVLYLPPIHPIGKSHRKGPNNSTLAGPEDPGSPWAIGSEKGGHKAVDPGLGSLADFDHFRAEASRLGLEVALDLAFQCSPDHPYVREHPEWFYHRPDGTIKHAENPPKIYEDILPLDFDCAAKESLWEELLSVALFWVNHGVTLFRVDNPHTKPYAFWKWLIAEVRAQHPDVVFLAEAFARPKIMAYLAKSGFSQSYSYFTWRNTKSELTEYFTELTQSPLRDTLRPNLFTNTPDILSEYLQMGGRPAFQIRLFLAATLGASYGIYGPAFELCEARAISGTEDYQDSEKYQYHVWDRDRSGNIKEWVRLVNRIRRDNPAIRFDRSLRFYPVTNESLLCYTKSTPDLENLVLVVVNLDPWRSQDGWVQVRPSDLGISGDQSFQVHDLLSGARYLWHGESNYVRLDPSVCPAHIFRVRRKVKTEKDFDYFG